MSPTFFGLPLAQILHVVSKESQLYYFIAELCRLCRIMSDNNNICKSYANLSQFPMKGIGMLHVKRLLARYSAIG